MSKKKSHLVAFGCSHTYGQDLPDNCGFKHPSNYAWPKLLADLLGKTCVNLGNPGASPKEVSHIITCYKFESKKTPTVIIQWPNIDRWCILPNREHRPRINMLPRAFGKDFPQIYYDALGITRERYQNILNFYYSEIHHEYDSSFDLVTHMCFIDSYLRKKGIIPIHLIPQHYKIETVHKELIKELAVKYYNWKQHFQVDLALDQSHPGVESHKLFAKNIKNWFFK